VRDMGERKGEWHRVADIYWKPRVEKYVKNLELEFTDDPEEIERIESEISDLDKEIERTKW
jgi:hypothetical protein